MDRQERPNRAQLAALVEAAATRERAARGPLAALVAAQRPGPVDHSLPAAAEWLRRWRPQRLTATAPDCTCAAGRCTWCN
jgi:hypothetical protein